MEEPQGVALPITYVGLDELTVALANHFVLQVDRGEFILTIGQVAPPVVLGDEGEQQEQVRQMTYVPAKPLVRVVLSRARVEELRLLCERQLKAFDEVFGGSNDSRSV